MDIDLDSSALQSDLESIYRWADGVNMVFNGDKFEVIRFWPKSDKKPDIKYLDPEGDDIQEKAHLRDLGVEIANDLSFKLHAENVIAVANKLIGWVLRTFRRRARKLLC